QQGEDEIDERRDEQERHRDHYPAPVRPHQGRHPPDETTVQLDLIERLLFVAAVRVGALRFLVPVLPAHREEPPAPRTSELRSLGFRVSVSGASAGSSLESASSRA